MLPFKGLVGGTQDADEIHGARKSRTVVHLPVCLRFGLLECLTERGDLGTQKVDKRAVKGTFAKDYVPA